MSIYTENLTTIVQLITTNWIVLIAYSTRTIQRNTMP